MSPELFGLLLAWLAVVLPVWACKGDAEDADTAHTYPAGIAEEVQP